MEAKVNPKALAYMDKEGIPYRTLEDGTVEVDMYYIKKGQFQDLESILQTGGYPGENVEEKEPFRTYTLSYLDGDKLFKVWKEEKDGPWPYHPDSTCVREYVDQWMEPHKGIAQVVDKNTPEEKVEDFIVLDKNSDE